MGYKQFACLHLYLGLGLPLAMAAVLLGPKLYPFETLVTLDLLDDFHKRPFPSKFVTEMTKINKVPFYSSKNNNSSC